MYFVGYRFLVATTATVTGSSLLEQVIEKPPIWIHKCYSACDEYNIPLIAVTIIYCDLHVMCNVLLFDIF